MAVALDSNPANATFNCYVSLAEAEDYFYARIHVDTWTAALSKDKEKALMWATRQLNTLRWKGVRTVGSQPMEFPRKDLSYYEYDSYGTVTKIEITSTGVPEPIKDATCELALWLLGSDTTAPSGTENFSRIKIDVIDIQFKPTETARWLNTSVKNLIWRFVANNNRYVAQTQRVG